LIHSLYHFLAARWRFNNLRGQTLRDFQAKRARQVVAYTAQHSSFYRLHWKGYDLTQWQSLPITDKALMMANFDSFNTMGISREQALQVALQAERDRNFAPTLKRLTVGLSSGTSGHRGIFLVSQAEQAAWAGVILARVLHGPLKQALRQLLSGLRVAFFLRSNSNLYQSTGRFIQFRYFDLMAPPDEIINGLNRFQPEILIAPPSLLGLLAKAISTGQLTIKPKRVISVAEVLEPQDKEKLSSIFQVPIEEIYQCTEGLVAVTCSEGRLHLQEDLLGVQYEVVGDHVQPILTDLWRRTQPIIRYRLNDLWQLDDRPCPCGCGFQVLKQVEGRSDDLCYFNSRVIFPDAIRKAILLASDEIEEYEAVQEHAGQLTVRLVVRATANFDAVAESVKRSIADTLAGYSCQAETLTVEEGIPLRLPGAKRRRVRNLSRQNLVN
jgi:phenylacetate-CoA ligase